MKVSIVVPNWNGAEKLKRNLPKVLEVKGVNEVVVSDDASTDESTSLLKSEFPEVKLMIREKNEGFSSNVNSGVKVATGDLIFLLNNDAVPEKNALEAVLPHFENPKVFAVGCKVGDGLWTGGKFENGFFWHGQPHKVEPCEAKAHQTLWASGGSGIFRRTIWDELGGLDTLYNPFYEEDVDLGYRATKRGYLNIWEPESKVEHYKEIGVIASHFSKSTVAHIAERNHLIFIWKNITSNTLTREHKKALVKMLLKHPRYWTVFLAALAKFPEISTKRNIEKKQAKLTDEEIFRIFSLG